MLRKGGSTGQHRRASSFRHRKGKNRSGIRAVLQLPHIVADAGEALEAAFVIEEAFPLRRRHALFTAIREKWGRLDFLVAVFGFVLIVTAAACSSAEDAVDQDHLRSVPGRRDWDGKQIPQRTLFRQPRRGGIASAAPFLAYRNQSS